MRLGAAPEAGGGANPSQQIIEGAMQAVQQNDGNLALQVCQMIVGLIQGAGGAAPAGEEVAATAFRMGGSMSKKDMMMKKKKR